jgi:excisionase family DNA binding protein
VVRYAGFSEVVSDQVEAQMGIRETYITVQEAAEILGVAANTVRKWGAAGKIPEYRHPANGYRLYKREDLERFLRKIETTKSAPVRRKG